MAQARIGAEINAPAHLPQRLGRLHAPIVPDKGIRGTVAHENRGLLVWTFGGDVLFEFPVQEEVAREPKNAS